MAIDIDSGNDNDNENDSDNDIENDGDRDMDKVSDNKSLISSRIPDIRLKAANFSPGGPELYNR